MSADDLTATAIVVAIAFVLGSGLLGVLGWYLLNRKASRSDPAEESRTYVIVLRGLSKVVLPASLTAGAYGATISLPLRPALEQLSATLLLAAAILTGTFAAARITAGLVSFYAARHQRLPGATSIFSNIARFIVLAVGALVALQTLGVSVGPVLTALGVGGLAVALALQDTLANLFAGLHVIGSRKVVPGDYVVLDSGEEGYVEDINWRNTSLRNLRNNMIVVPNARLASAILTNYYQPAAEMALLVPIGVSYDSDLGVVERVTTDVGREVMNEVAGGVPDFEPIIRYHTFDDSSIDFNVILRVKEHTDQYLVRHEFVKRVHDRYRETGIVIPFPIQTVIAGEQEQSDRAVRALTGT
ncbi:MAG TPA: mechanosensitive ion channel family protein [Actinomycetota bacterium]|nr:mechanosensitive ion channel family protein [Actinomycetota bacterium]